MNVINMKSLIFLLLITACNTRPEALSCFSHPLILGASVSAGYGTSKGGTSTIIAKMLNTNAVIDNRARSGSTSLQSIKNVELESLSPSIVIGLDLFFWDAARNQCGDSFVEHTQKLFKTLKGTPLIIGKIPVGTTFPEGFRLAGSRPCTQKVNALLEKLCTIENNCLLYDPKDCLEAMQSDEGYFMDKLHPTDKGNEFCAKKFIQSGDYKSLTCS